MALEDRNSPISATSPAPGDKNQTNEADSRDIKQEPYEPEKNFSSFSIERLTTSSPTQVVDEEPSRQPNNPSPTWIKFSVENILKPNFGTKCDIVRKCATPIFERNRLTLRRSFDVTRLNEEQPKRRHSADLTETNAKPSTTPSNNADGNQSSNPKELWPAWVYCTRYSDRPSSGPRSRRTKRKESKKPEEKRPRTAFSGDQLCRLRAEFNENRYLTERRRQNLARELNLNEAQIKIWFQNKRAKMKKAKGEKNPLAMQLMAQGLYNHSTVASEEDEYLEEMARSVQAQTS